MTDPFAAMVADRPPSSANESHPMILEQERLIERLENIATWLSCSSSPTRPEAAIRQAATELRRSYAECDALREALTKIEALPLISISAANSAAFNGQSLIQAKQLSRTTLQKSKECEK